MPRGRLLAILGLCLAGAAWAAGPSVSQAGKTFSPGEIAAGLGQSVRIVNDDIVPHNVQITGPDGETRNLGLQMPGDRADVAIDTLGDFMVHCGIHPKMKLVIHAH